MEAGQIYVDEQFYCDTETGEFLPKYFLVLALDQGGDVVARLLTSRATGRRTNPKCDHGLPYPSFYFGVICAALPRESWLDLRALEDFERRGLDKRVKSGLVHLVHVVEIDVLRAALGCAAAADDTTIRQERMMRDQLAALR